MFSDDLFEDQDVVEAESEWDVLLLSQQGIKAVYRNPNYDYDEYYDDSYITDMLIQQTNEEWEKQIKSQYLMGTPEETFLKNVWHFGLLKALHRHFERICVRYVSDEWRVHKEMRYNPHNFVFYRVPWWKFSLCSRIESILRKKVYPRKK